MSIDPIDEMGVGVRREYEPPAPPDFTPNIPEHLLKNIEPQDRYLLEMVSRIEQRTSWLIGQLESLHRDVYDLESGLLAENVRLKKVEDWKQSVTSKWALAAGTGAIVFTAAVTAAFKQLFNILAGGMHHD